jgi:hypothetical protein
MKLHLFAILMAGVANVFAADCASTPDSDEIGSRFLLKGELAFDNKTKLTWQRCGFGQHYKDGRCSGALKLVTYTEAKQAALKAGKGWRVPSLNELASLVVKKCAAPMLNQSVFPDVREISEGKAKYWASDRDKDLPTLIYNVDFIGPGMDANTSGIAMGLRLVRLGALPE